MLSKLQEVGSNQLDRDVVNILILLQSRLLHCDVKNRWMRQERYDIREDEGVHRRIRISLCDNTSSVHISGRGGDLALGGGCGDACNVRRSNLSMCIVTDFCGTFQARAFKN
jgi:hypothetical protein